MQNVGLKHPQENGELGCRRYDSVHQMIKIYLYNSHMFRKNIMSGCRIIGTNPTLLFCEICCESFNSERERESGGGGIMTIS